MEVMAAADRAALAQARELVAPPVILALRLMPAAFAAVTVLHVAMRGIAPVVRYALVILVACRTQQRSMRLLARLLVLVLCRLLVLLNATLLLHFALVHARRSQE